MGCSSNRLFATNKTVCTVTKCFLKNSHESAGYETNHMAMAEQDRFSLSSCPTCEYFGLCRLTVVSFCSIVIVIVIVVVFLSTVTCRLCVSEAVGCDFQRSTSSHTSFLFQKKHLILNAYDLCLCLYLSVPYSPLLTWQIQSRRERSKI